MYYLLQLNTNYLSEDSEEISLPAETLEGETMLNEPKVIKYIHFKVKTNNAVDPSRFINPKQKKPIVMGYKQNCKHFFDFLN